MDKSILLAFSYVLQNSGFHLTYDQAFSVIFRGSTNFGGRAKGKQGTPDTFTILSPLASQKKKEEETPDHRLVSIFHVFQILPQIFRWWFAPSL